MLSIGILGGSFNPAHEGHIHISEIAYKELNLHKVIWAVSPANPHKDVSLLNDFAERISDAKALTQNKPFIKVSDLENHLSRYSNKNKYYSYNFLKRFKTLHPKYEINFIIGSDNLINFHKWYRYKNILELVNLVVIDRPKYKYKALSSKVGRTKNYTYINAKGLGISSTEIRNRAN